MRRGQKWTFRRDSAQLKEAIDMRLGGATLTEIARRFGVTPAGVLLAFKRSMPPDPPQCKLRIENGYMFAYLPKTPGERFSGRQAVHRLVVQLRMRRSLRSGEIVHHLDGNRLNNSLRNLVVLPSRARHQKVHSRPKSMCSGCRQKPMKLGARGGLRLCLSCYGHARRYHDYGRVAACGSDRRLCPIARCFAEAK